MPPSTIGGEETEWLRSVYELVSARGWLALQRFVFVLALNSIDPRYRGQFGVTKSDTIF